MIELGGRDALSAFGICDGMVVSVKSKGEWKEWSGGQARDSKGLP